MIAVDTNIVVRAIVDDDANQVEQVRALLQSRDVFVPLTVLLEAEWVLRSLYGLTRAVIAQALETFCGLDQVQVENVDHLERTLAVYRHGTDFADALHVLQCEFHGVTQFATFDKRLRKKLGELSRSVSIIEP